MHYLKGHLSTSGLDLFSSECWQRSTDLFAPCYVDGPHPVSLHPYWVLSISL